MIVNRLLTIDEISGILDHSPSCKQLLEMDRNASIPLHPDLKAFALSLLRDNIPLTQLRQMCKQWACQRWRDEQGDNRYRFRLNQHDPSSLYRKISHERGIAPATAAEENLDRWLRSDCPIPPDCSLTQSILHYQPCVEGICDRLIMIIATPEMKVAAWQYAHSHHIFLDLTFGFSSARANLLIIMALDEQKTGIPIGLIIFTAKADAKAVHADYNTELIKSLLEKWRQGLGTMGGNQFEFLEPQVATTDYDTRERTALQELWPSMLLLLCMFHIWQCWRNGLNRYLAAIPKGPDRLEIRRHLAKFLMQLLKEITTYPEAITAYNNQIMRFKQLGCKDDRISKLQSKAALSFLHYLNSYLRIQSLWLAWSMGGVIEAAKRLKIPVDDIPRTNNHLESFNGRIKLKYFKMYMHSGRLPRIDLWVLLVITRVIPDFFHERADRRAQQAYYVNMRQALPQALTHTNFTDSDSVSLQVTTTVTSNQTRYEEQLDEQEMIDMMVEDDGTSTTDSDLDDDGVPLATDLTPSTPSPTRAPTPIEHGNDSVSIWGSEGDALDQDAILQDLTGDAVTLDVAGNASLAFELSGAYQELSISTSISNAQATAMQDMLQTQDVLGNILRKLRSLKVDDETLAIYTPRYLQPHVFGDLSSPEPINLESNVHCAAASAAATSLVTLTQAIRDSEGFKLIPLAKQKKESRKPSYGIR